MKFSQKFTVFSSSFLLYCTHYLIGSPNEIPLFGPPILEKAVQSLPRVKVSEVFSYDIYLTTELSETIKMTESVLMQIFILLSSGVARQNKQVQQIPLHYEISAVFMDSFY